FRRKERVLVALAYHFLALPTVHPLVGLVDIDPLVSTVPQHQRIGGRVEDRAVLLLARAQRLLCTAALGHVPPYVKHVRLAPMQDRNRAQFEFVARSVASYEGHFKTDRLSGQAPGG